MSGAPVVAHVDHSTARGGAELALRRMVAGSPAWQPRVLVPRSAAGADGGAFAGLASGVVVEVGPPQHAGLGARSGAVGAALGAVLLARTALALRRAPAFRTADVVHANTSRAAAYTALAVRGDQRLVVHLRDLVDPALLGRHGAAALQLALRRADGVVANSRATLASASALLRPGTPTLVLASPLGLDALRGAGPAPEVGDGAPGVVGMVARMAGWKGQELLVEAFAQAYAGTGTRLRLVGAALFGDDDVVGRVRALADRLGVAGQLDLPGHVDDVGAEIAALDVCVQASTQPEPLGQNVLQYLALGRPTVVADAGGPLEWVRDGVNGLVFRTGDAASLAGALKRMADPALRVELARGARATAVPTDAEIGAQFARFVAELPRRQG
ncbi:MAG: glycosyltransferase [Promicromonosporaceae bacterium]|nr:glycosyltransferase [Promicromonosporaceae bacterium]